MLPLDILCDAAITFGRENPIPKDQVARSIKVRIFVDRLDEEEGREGAVKFWNDHNTDPLPSEEEIKAMRERGAKFRALLQKLQQAQHATV